MAEGNRTADNRIENSGGDSGIASDIQGKTKDVRIARNAIHELRGPMQRTGIRISQDAQRIELEDNQFEGLATDVLDLRS